MLGIIVIVLLVILLFGGLPTYRYGPAWGDTSGPLGLVLLVLLIVILFAFAGHIYL